MLLYVIPSGNTILNENTSLLENQRATWKKDRVPSEISAPEPRKDRVLTRQHRRLRGHKCYFDPYTRKFHHSRSPILLWRSSSWGSQQAGMLDGICFPGSSILRFAMFYGYARRGHTYLLRQYAPPPLLTFSTMFLSTRKYVASRVCRSHLRWHYIYIYIYI